MPSNAAPQPSSKLSHGLRQQQNDDINIVAVDNSISLTSNPASFQSKIHQTTNQPANHLNNNGNSNNNQPSNSNSNGNGSSSAMLKSMSFPLIFF